MGDVEKRLDALERRLQSLPPAPLTPEEVRAKLAELPLEQRCSWSPEGNGWALWDLAAPDAPALEVRSERPADDELADTLAIVRAACAHAADSVVGNELAALLERLEPATNVLPLDLGSGPQIQPEPARPPAAPRPKKPKPPAPSGSMYGPGMTDTVIQHYTPGELGGQREGHSRWRGWNE